MFIRYCRVPVPVPVPARTLPYLIYRFLIYLPTYCMQEPPQQGIIHPLPPFLPPGCRLSIYLYLCVCASVCVRVSVRVSVRVHTYIHTLAYPQKVHRYQRYISKIHVHVCLGGMWLFLILKIYLPIRSTQKTTRRTSVHPPCLSQTSLGEFMCKPKQNFPFKLVP